MSDHPVSACKHPDFSVMLGGPLYRLCLRANLARPSMELVPRRIVTAIAITWLPLVVLSALGGDLVGGVGVAFVYDFEAHVRLLISVPLFFGGELVTHRVLQVIVEEFEERQIIAVKDQTSFASIIAGVMRLADSAILEISLGALAFSGYWLWRSQFSLHIATWYAVGGPDSPVFTAAGYWYAFVSLPIARFILLRWYFRLLLWYVVLFMVSRLDLQLNAMHPDRAGGLGFVSDGVLALAPALAAQSAVLSGTVASQILNEGATLPDFKILIVGSLAFLMLIAFLPFGFFALQLARARRAGLRKYGLMATRYASEFRDKWLQAPENCEVELLGSADIQSLADLANGYAVIEQMRPLPFGRDLVMKLAVVIVMPLLPLVLTMVPFEQLLQQLIKVVI